LGELLGGELSELVCAATPRELADLDARERLSVAMRRVALRDHSVEARWRQICAAAGIEVPSRPMVSVILATRREEWLEHGLSQVSRQSYEPRELVVCLHGDGFSEGVEERIRAAVGGRLKVVRVDEELTLGDVLNAGVEASEGELVTKMDDDDYYNVDHLWDLVLACEYSGADLVGKAAEFVYLEDIDVTIRQLTHDVDTRLAGGGMMMRKGPLVELGGWPPRTRGEDLAIIRTYAGHHKGIHRIPPLGYILNRHGRGHTWRPAVDYFLFRSERTWRGLCFDQTAIEPPEADVRPG
jgi:glycosyltransferase involved in cell wall biosynthesis